MTMRQLSIDELKAIQLDLLDEVHSFCMAHGLRYSLTGGSLIGSIRHKGYIPWDDDIDIMLPRPDYEQFLQLYRSKDNEAVDLMKSDLCVETFCKVCRKGTIITDPELKRSLWGVNIDLFPVDGFSSSEEQAKCHFDRLQSYNENLGVYCPFFRTVGDNKAFWLAKYVLKRIIHFYPHSYRHFKSEFLHALLSQPFDDSQFVALYCGGDGWREVMPKNIFEKYMDTEFEGRSYRIIAHYDDYLRRVFGDYMQLPPENERCNKHRYDYYIL